jgi:hypothetical protein
MKRACDKKKHVQTFSQKFRFWSCEYDKCLPYLCICHVIGCRLKSFCYYWLGHKESRWRYRRRIFKIRIAVSCPCRIQLRPSVLLAIESSTMSQGKRILCKAARPIVGTTSPPIRYTPLDIRRRQRGRNVKLTSRLILVARLRLRGAIPPLPCMALCLVLK